MDNVTRPYDVTSNIIAFESGELDDAQVIELFQHLVDNGMAWTLQGSYGRTAVALMQAGLVKSPKTMDEVRNGRRNPHHISD